MVDLIPPEDLAIQWDLAIEQRLVEVKLAEEGVEAARREAERVMAPLADIPVPSDVALGHHACFGTLSGWPSRQPPNIEGAVLLLNAAVAASGRRVDFLHIPTLGSAEDAFFAPLENLKPDGARIYMGAIHHLHGAGGLQAQIKTMRKYLHEFGLGAPCGWGRARSGLAGS